MVYLGSKSLKVGMNKYILYSMRMEMLQSVYTIQTQIFNINRILNYIRFVEHTFREMIEIFPIVIDFSSEKVSAECLLQTENICFFVSRFNMPFFYLYFLYFSTELCVMLLYYYIHGMRYPYVWGIGNSFAINSFNYTPIKCTRYASKLDPLL